MALSAPLPQQQRVIFVCTPQGAPNEEWRPDDCGSSFTLRRASSPLEPVKQHCVFFRNIFIPDSGHGISEKVLGGGFSEGRETTLDIHLGEVLSAHTAMTNLHLCTHAVDNDFASKKANQKIPFIDSAVSVYEQLFGARESIRFNGHNRQSLWPYRYAVWDEVD